MNKKTNSNKLLNNNLNKSKQEILNSIWKETSNLISESGLEDWEFSSILLRIIFYRFLSEFFLTKINETDNNLDYENYHKNNNEEDLLQWRQRIVENLGFFILPSQLFSNVLKEYKLTTFDESDLNTKLPSILEGIQNTSKLNQKAKNAFDGLFSDFREILNKLSKDNLSLRNKNLLEILQKVNDMPLSISKKDNSVQFADAFEYLITMFGSITNKEAKSFFTPYNVSKLLIQLALFNIQDKTDITIYDPTCGSGSLMLKILKYIDKENIEMFYGQDKQNQAFDFCRMNMLLHLIPYDKFDIKCGNTLTNDLFKSEGKFDIIVSHPPLNEKWEQIQNDDRFLGPSELPPSEYSDYAFIEHCLYHLSEEGCFATICFPGILYRGKKEEKIRKWIFDNNWIDAVISLGEKMFLGTDIGLIILILRKNKKDNQILFINAENEWIKDKVMKQNKGKNNRKIESKNTLSDANIAKIYDAYIQRKDIDKFSKLVDVDAVINNNYNLSVNNYVSLKDKEEKPNITLINEELKEIVNHTNELRVKIDSLIKEIGD